MTLSQNDPTSKRSVSKRSTSKSSTSKSKQRKNEADIPSMTIEKKPSKSSTRPRSVEFRLATSDEDNNDDEREDAKKRVTYKAADRDQAFFPELNDADDDEHQELPPYVSA